MCLWPATTLCEGGVDNLPKFLFVNELKEIIMEEEKGIKKKSLKLKHIFCSSKFCKESAVNYCEYLCQLCSDDHCSSRVTKHHTVVPAYKGEIVSRRKRFNQCQPCHQHNHQVIDIYCIKCKSPICRPTTCCQVNHRGHDCIEIDKQAKICKTELEKMKQADDDIDEICENVKFAFQIMHNKLDKEELMII